MLADIVQEEFGVDLAKLKGRSRKHIHVAFRATCYYLIKTLHSFKLTDIGAFFDRDHTTILYGLSTHQELYLTDHKDYRRRFKHIETIYKVKLAAADPIDADSAMKEVIEIEKMIKKLERTKDFLLRWCVTHNKLPL